MLWKPVRDKMSMCFSWDEGDVHITTRGEFNGTIKVRRTQIHELNEQVTSLTCEGAADHLMLSKMDREAQCALYNLSELNGQASGPPLVELDWCDFNQKKVCANFNLKDLTELAGIITTTNGKVKANGRRGSVSDDIVKAK